MAADYKCLNMDFPDFKCDNELKEKFITFIDKDIPADDILLLLSYNGLLEYQYIS